MESQRMDQRKDTGGAEGEGRAPGLDRPQTELLERFRKGHRIALARAISMVENERPGFQPFLDALLRPGFRAARLGVTGPPGAGKSTLVAALATACRERDEEVGIVAVDPTSPFSGGALLGDRIRMHDVATDPGIFIRSMATRGSVGGLAITTKEAIDVMDAFGFPRVIVETVGVGQSELEITGATDTVVVVLVPESGDGVQAMKAGLMEIADVFVVNKADRPGAEQLVKEIRLALRLRQGASGRPADTGHHGVDLSRMGRRGSAGPGGEGASPGDAAASGDEAAAGERDGADDDAAARGAGRSPVGADRSHAAAGAPEEGLGAWQPPIIQTVAQSGEGVAELLEAVDRHRSYLKESGELDRRRRARALVRVQDVLRRELSGMAVRATEGDPEMDREVAAIVAGRETPYSVARRILEKLGVREAAVRLPEEGSEV